MKILRFIDLDKDKDKAQDQFEIRTPTVLESPGIAPAEITGKVEGPRCRHAAPVYQVNRDNH